MSADDDPIATPSQTAGPFFHLGLASHSTVGTQSAAKDADAAPIWLRVTVTDGEGSPVPDAWLEVWEQSRTEPLEVGRLPTDRHGACEFQFIQTGTHLNVCLFARGLLRHLTTRVYFEGDSGIADDPVLALVPAGRRATLVAHLDAGGSRRWRFDIRLQGDDETVFFDV